MYANQGRVGATVVGIFVLIIVFLVFLRPSSSKPAPARTSARSGRVRGELSFDGQGDRTLGVITVRTRSEAQFDCPTCEQYGFSVTSDDPADPEDGLNTASPSGESAQFEVAAGRYAHVRVDTRGSAWTLTITPVRGG